MLNTMYFTLVSQVIVCKDIGSVDLRNLRFSIKWKYRNFLKEFGESDKPLIFQAAAVREELTEFRDQTKRPVIKSEAQSFSEELGSNHFRFIPFHEENISSSNGASPLNPVQVL